MEVFSNRHVRRLAVVAGLAAGVVLGCIWYFGLDLDTYRSAWKALESWLVRHPGWLWLALIVLPAFPVPSSALVVTAGVVWRQHPALACAACVSALLLNMLWTYAVAAGPGRRLVEHFLKSTRLKIPELPRGDHLRLILILRLTPGMPFFIQNYVLGFLQPPFRLYLPVSLACNAPVACGMVLSGAGLANGRIVPLVLGVGLIVLAAALTHFGRRWLATARSRKLAR